LKNLFCHDLSVFSALLLTSQSAKWMTITAKAVIPQAAVTTAPAGPQVTVVKVKKMMKYWNI